jgi:hypothetical protein
MRFYLTLAAVGLASMALSAPAPDQALTFVDLQPKANQKLKDNLHTANFDNNNLADLPKGKQTFAGISFVVGEGLVQLGSKQVTSFPEKVEDIKVDAKFSRLHLLHATGYKADEDAVVGKYLLHYEDKGEETIEIVYGKDVRDWWCAEGDKDVSRGKVAWKGTNEAAKSNKSTIRLYLTTWKNPKPDKKVSTIDYSSTMTDAAPFLVAMTLEDK